MKIHQKKNIAIMKLSQGIMGNNSGAMASPQGHIFG
jgi:hypothetical protein